MGFFKSIFVTALVVLVGVYLQSDCDLFLRFLPEIPANAFSGQVVWITGASSGIGAALAEALVKEGAEVIISARRVSNLEDVANRAAVHGKRPYVLPLDVLDPEAQAAAYDLIKQKYGHVDTLVLNAGRGQKLSGLETSIEDTRDLFELNFFSFVNSVKIVAPDFIDRKQGQIVVVSSIAGKMGLPTASSYSATKYALHGYFDALRAEIAQHNISISLVCPGPVESEITKSFIGKKSEIATEKKDVLMTGERCASLMIKAIYHKVSEVVITKQPFMLFMDLILQFPYLMRLLLTKLVGPNLLKADDFGNVSGYFKLKQ